MTNNIQRQVKDPFQSIADHYVKYRPHYPETLYKYLSSLCENHNAAWDCATGNGQVAVALTDYFNSITATDRSEGMLQKAVPYPKVTYRQALAENSGLPDNHFDLVTIGTALHWLNAEKFFAEVNRVLKPNGVIAAWGYVNSIIEPEIDALTETLYKDTLGPYWASDMNHIWSGFNSKPFPFEDIKPPQFSFTREWNFQDLLNYLQTWSALEEFEKQNGYDALQKITPDLLKVWGDPINVKKISWDLVLKVGRKM